MATNEGRDTSDGKKIEVRGNGVFIVHGDVPLVRKIQIVSEYGEPLTWEKGELFETNGTYYPLPLRAVKYEALLRRDALAR